MKYILKLVIAFLTIIVLNNCKSNDDMNENKSIIGTWQLVEVLQGNNGPMTWHPVNNGYTYTFLGNGNFSSSRFDECDMGTYSIELDDLILNFSCEDSGGAQFVEEMSFESEFLILTPTYTFCIDGVCSSKFEKIN